VRQFVEGRAEGPLTDGLTGMSRKRLAEGA
jgi:hypothetical protein